MGSRPAAGTTALVTDDAALPNRLIPAQSWQGRTRCRRRRVLEGQLRARLRAARRRWLEAVPPEGREARSQALADAVLGDPAMVALTDARGGAVAAYASMPTEPPTNSLLDRLATVGIPVLLPVALPDGRLAWVRDEGPAHRQPDPRGIPTPTRPPLGVGASALLAAGVSVVLVPALAVGIDGRRLGQGGGYYDRLLRHLPTPAQGGPMRVAIIGPPSCSPPEPSPPPP